MLRPHPSRRSAKFAVPFFSPSQSLWLHQSVYYWNHVLRGIYRNPAAQAIEVNPKSGQGDVIAEFATNVLAAECEGGVINSRRPGQRSKLI